MEQVFSLPKMRKSSFGTNFPIALCVLIFSLPLYAGILIFLPKTLWILAGAALIADVLVARVWMNYEKKNLELYNKTLGREVVLTPSSLKLSLAYLFFDDAGFDGLSRPLKFLREKNIPVEDGYLTLDWDKITGFEVYNPQTRKGRVSFRIKAECRGVSLQLRCPVAVFGDQKKEFMSAVGPRLKIS